MSILLLLALKLILPGTANGLLRSGAMHFEKLPRFGVSSYQTFWATASAEGSILVTAHDDGWGKQDPGGKLFRYSPKTGTLDTLFVFSGEKGAAPTGTLVQTNNPNVLLGVTNLGGKSGLGTIYEINLATKQHTVLFHFTEEGPSNPVKGLLAINDHQYVGLCDTSPEPRPVPPYYGGPYKNVPFLFDRQKGTISFFNPKPEYGYVIGLPVLLNKDVLVFLYEKEGKRHRVIEYSLSRKEVTSDVKSPFWFKPNGSLIKGKDSCLYVMHYYTSANSATYPFFCYDAKTKTCSQRALGSRYVTMYSGEAVADAKGEIYGWFKMGPRTMPHGLAFRFIPSADSVAAFIEWPDQTNKVDDETNLQLTPGYDFNSNPVIGTDGMLYAVSEDSGLISIDLATRKIKRLVKY